jgi:hypothetical protein
MANLGDRPASGILLASNKITPGGWVVTFKPQDMPPSTYEVWHGFAKGPGGYALVYLDEKGYGVIENGLISEYAPSGGAMYVRPGQIITIHWSTATGAAPNVVLYVREPEVGRL